MAWLLLCTLVLAARAQEVMPLPPHSSPFTGNVRGYWFTAPVDFNITGLHIPTDASTAAQSIAVLRLTAAPPLYATTTDDFEVLFLTQNNPAEGVIPVNIPVQSGDIIGILGQRGTTNSYGPVGPSTIYGQPVTLSRFGMQFPLTTTPPQQVWTENGGSISRVTMHYGPYAPLTPPVTLVDDAAVATSGPTRVYPLANDPFQAQSLAITAVSEPSVSISTDGRSVLAPAGYTGTFTYTASGPGGNGTANVVITAGTALASPRKFVGLLYDATGAQAGWSTVNQSPKGSATIQILTATGKGRTQFSFPLANPTATAPTAIGDVTLTRNADGTMGVVLAAQGGDLSGALRPALTTTTPVKHHIALASIDAAIPGGGYAIANVKSSGLAIVAGLLPDGRPFRLGTMISDNGTLSFWGFSTRFVVPPALVAGEFVSADLPLTDVTGDIRWNKPPQDPGAKGLHLGGLNTLLTANGCAYSGLLPAMTTSTLRLSGGGLPAPEENTVAVTSAIPAVPTGALRNWGNVKQEVGQFRAKVLAPGIPKPVFGNGLYLPKSNSAWGFFPGLSVGGRIELQGPALPPPPPPL